MLPGEEKDAVLLMNAVCISHVATQNIVSFIGLFCKRDSIGYEFCMILNDVWGCYA